MVLPCERLKDSPIQHESVDKIGKEFDTYRIGVEKLSTSTMHKLTDRPLLIEDFDVNKWTRPKIQPIIYILNEHIEQYKQVKEKGDILKAQEIWRTIIELLPESYIQKRTVMMSYAALSNIIRQREGHKLYEWEQFIDWCRLLPEAWALFE